LDDDGKVSEVRSRSRFSLFGLVYLGVGVAVAATHHYFANLHTIRQVLSAVLAVVLWPLILLGISLHIRR
jgi:hypothetical protein